MEDSYQVGTLWHRHEHVCSRNEHGLSAFHPTARFHTRQEENISIAKPNSTYSAEPSRLLPSYGSPLFDQSNREKREELEGERAAQRRALDRTEEARKLRRAKRLAKQELQKRSIALKKIEDEARYLRIFYGSAGSPQASRSYTSWTVRGV